MKLPFFKSSKPGSGQPSKPTVAVLPGAPAVPSPQRPAPIRPQNESGSRKPAKVLPPILLPVTWILPDLPRDLFAPGTQDEVAKLTIELPASWVLPQLSTGNINLRVVDLIPHLPKDLLRQPIPPISDLQTVALPLAQMVASIPPEVFEVKHQSAIDLNGPDFAALPQLVNDVPDQKPAVVIAPPVETMPPIPAEFEAAPTPPADAPSQQVWINLRSLLNVIPDHLLSQPRSVLCGQVDPEARAALPLEPILPQLTTASVKLPLSTIVAAMPAPLLVSPLPRDLSEAVSLPLDEIVPQISPDVFDSVMGAPHPDLMEQGGIDIPSPFIEASPPVPPEPIHPVAPPQPPAVVAAPVQAPAPAPVSTEISTAALDNEGFTLFGEKTEPAVPPPPTKPAAPAPAEPIAPPPQLESVSPVMAETPSPETIVPTEPIKPTPLLESASTVVAEETPSPSAVEPALPIMPAPMVPGRTFGVMTLGGIEGQRYLINLNSCSAADLTRIRGIGPVMAKRLVEFRTGHGPFSSLDELRLVPGIGRKTFRALTGIGPRRLNRLLGVPEDRELSLLEIVRLVGALPGVDGCIVALEDGLFVTGQLPPPLDQNAVSAFGPQLFKRIGRYVRELNIGQVHRLTLFTDQRPVSIFHAGNVYLIVVHGAKRYSKALLRRCERVSQEIAGLCRQRATI
jgi:competence protein ComEA